MVERILLRRVRERLVNMVALYERVYEEWYKKVEEEVQRSNSLSLRSYNELMRDIHGRMVECLQLIERLVELEKEVGQVETVDEAAKVLAYYIMELEEGERKEVLEFIKKLKERRRVLV
jgi:hypothetical protein